jgi:hypothetical protein
LGSEPPWPNADSSVSARLMASALVMSIFLVAVAVRQIIAIARRLEEAEELLC